jgi:S-adenosylmethionine decarboxylase proenzyme
VQFKLEALGKHILVEFYGCDVNLLNKATAIKGLMEDAARSARATIVESFVHQFSPFGVSGVVVIAESHLTIHTWPEYGYAAVDLFTCGDEVDPWKCYYYLLDKLKAKHSTTIELRRGTLDTPYLRHKPSPVKVAA